MAQLLISAAVNIAVGLLINALFPPPDIEQEGPRLTELGFTSATYGKFVNVLFGTDRISGNIIDATDPPIEEMVNTESESVGKGGGQQTNTTTYTYFLTCRIAWCIEGADAILRLWGDGKVIFDATGSSQPIKEGVTMTFYPGGQDQLQDPEEVTRRDSDIPAYGHLTTIKLDRMPLADYGNRIPNFTAELTYNLIDATSTTNMVEPSSFSLSTAGPFDYDPDRNELHVAKLGAAPQWVADASTLSFKSFMNTTQNVGVQSAVGRDGFAYSSVGNANSGPLEKVEIETGQSLGTLGGSGIGLVDTASSFGNSGRWYQLSTTAPGLGVQSTVFHLQTAFGSANGAVVDADRMINPPGGFNPIVHVMSTADGLVADGGPLTGLGIPDHDTGVFYIFQDDDLNGEYRLVKYELTHTSGPDGILLAGVTATLVRRFTRGTFAGGDDFQGTGNPAGWAVNRKTGELILSNGTSMILYNPATDTILAQRANASFIAQFNYYSGSIFGYAISSPTNGTLRIIDTRTLEITKTILTDDIPWPSGVDGVIAGATSTWDDRSDAIYLSRVNSDAAVDFRILKVFVNQIAGGGVGLDTVVSALSTFYQRQTMAGLLPADIDVTTLAGDTVLGYTLNRQSTMKSALQPLRDRYLFDAHQSDWIIKFPKRGATPTVTIPEEDVGILKRGRDMTDEPAVREIRQDDLSLPMALAIRYRNKDTDYQIDVESDKRHLFPNQTMQSKSERTIDIPIVEQPTEMKRLAQKTLLTLWNERVSFKTIVPWDYIALDATDVFNMGVFNETHQLRLAENDLGHGWAIELTGVVEDTKSFSSTLAGGTSLGHVGTTVPSSLPTRLTPFDAPLLSLEDLLLTPISNAYMAVGAFEAGWAGATVMKSLDDVGYTPTGSVNAEAAIARVRTTPSAWGFVEGDFRNRFQDIADGGTLIITPLRRADEWVSAASEEIVLAGANTIGVIRAADQQVEILSFQDAVLNDNNTVTLTRLLRGRLGTEDIADLGISVGDTVILLSNATNVKEAGPVIRQRLTLSELSAVLLFKGVTIGTLIEDAPVISATYTGRDIRPYSVVHTTAVNSAGDVIVDWERRARGPLAAEWLDGTGSVVLNESIEQYTVLITDGANSITRTVDDATTTTFTSGDLSTAGVSGASTVTVTQVSGIPGFTSPITPSSTATVTV